MAAESQNTILPSQHNLRDRKGKNFEGQARFPAPGAKQQDYKVENLLRAIPPARFKAAGKFTDFFRPVYLFGKATLLSSFTGVKQQS